MPDEPNRWEFYIEIAEAAETLRRRVAKRPAFVPADEPTLTNALIGLAYHLRRAYHEAQTLAGPRPKPEPESAPAETTAPPPKPKRRARRATEQQP